MGSPFPQNPLLFQQRLLILAKFIQTAKNLGGWLRISLICSLILSIYKRRIAYIGLRKDNMIHSWLESRLDKTAMRNPTNPHRFILDDVLHNWHPAIVLLDQPQSISLTHSSLAMHRRRTGLSWGRQGGFRGRFTIVCVCGCVCWRDTGAFQGAGVNVRYEIRMQYKQRDAFKLN